MRERLIANAIHDCVEDRLAGMLYDPCVEVTVWKPGQAIEQNFPMKFQIRKIEGMGPAARIVRIRTHMWMPTYLAHHVTFFVFIDLDEGFDGVLSQIRRGYSLILQHQERIDDEVRNLGFRNAPTHGQYTQLGWQTIERSVACQLIELMGVQGSAQWLRNELHLLYENSIDHRVKSRVDMDKGQVIPHLTIDPVEIPHGREIGLYGYKWEGSKITLPMRLRGWLPDIGTRIGDYLTNAPESMANRLVVEVEDIHSIPTGPRSEMSIRPVIWYEPDLIAAKTAFG